MHKKSKSINFLRFFRKKWVIWYSCIICDSVFTFCYLTIVPLMIEEFHDRTKMAIFKIFLGYIKQTTANDNNINNNAKYNNYNRSWNHSSWNNNCWRGRLWNRFWCFWNWQTRTRKERFSISHEIDQNYRKSQKP